MDFDKFLERDIISFLDQQAIKLAEKAEGIREEEFNLYEVTEDYEKEITKALHENNLTKAQHIFEDIKNKYIREPEGSLSKKRFYIIMEEVYEKIKDYESKSAGQKSLFETIKEYEEKGLFNKPDLFKEKEAESINLILSTIIRKEKELENLAAKKQVGNKEIREGIQLYREMKELIRMIPEKYPDEKSRAYESALSWYYTLKNMKEIYRKEQEKKAASEKASEEAEEEKKTVEEILSEVRKLKESIIISHNKIAEFIKQRDLKSSMLEYQNLKKLCEAFPPEMEQEKIALLADALSLYESIKRMKDEVQKQGAQDKEELTQESQEKSEREKMRNDIKERLVRIRILLEKRDTSSVTYEYNDLKEAFKRYPDSPLQEKQDIYEQILAAHRDIRMLEQDSKIKSPSYDNKKIGELQKKLYEARALLEKGFVEESTHLLLEAKHSIQLLPKEAFNEHYRMSKEVEELEHKLLFIKNVEKINNPRLAYATHS